MKKLFFVMLCAGSFLTSCSDHESGSSIKRDQLGIIVIQANAQTNVLLMEDGSVIYPVSGIDVDEFNEFRLGRKLMIDYEPIKTENGVTHARIRDLAIADDTAFNPSTPSENVPIFSSTFSGQFFVSDADSTNVLTGEATFIFGAEEAGSSDVQFDINPNEGTALNGATTFILTEGQLVLSEDPGNILLPKTCNYSFMADELHSYLYLWFISDSDGLACYSLVKNN